MANYRQKFVAGTLFFISFFTAVTIGFHVFGQLFESWPRTQFVAMVSASCVAILTMTILERTGILPPMNEDANS